LAATAAAFSRSADATSLEATGRCRFTDCIQATAALISSVVLR
jgi:hypothetical protein